MYNLDQIIDKILFLDIETVSGAERLEDLSERMQKLWKKKSTKFRKDYEKKTSDSVIFDEKSAIQSEFGKIVCISTGYITRDTGDNLTFKTKSFYNTDEVTLLKEFADMILKFFETDPAGNFKKVCTHNGKEFDIPYIARRMLITGIELPPILDIAGKKPWDVKFILDTQEMWQFGDVKAFTSLDLLAAIFGIPTPKDDINGSEVSRVYWKEKDLERIKVYCEKDIFTTAQVFLKLNQLSTIETKEGATDKSIQDPLL